jgi:hypothetical protein
MVLLAIIFAAITVLLAVVLLHAATTLEIAAPLRGHHDMVALRTSPILFTALVAFYTAGLLMMCYVLWAFTFDFGNTRQFLLKKELDRNQQQHKSTKNKDLFFFVIVVLMLTTIAILQQLPL